VAQSEYILIGGGEHARVVLDVLLSQKISVRALFDPKYSGKLFGVDQLGEYNPERFVGAFAIAAIGNNATRKKVVASSKHGFGQAIHASAIVSTFAIIGEGTVIFQGSIIQANTKIGRHVIVNTGSQIDHDCMIGDFAHIAPGAILCGTVEVGEGTLIGAGVTIIPGIKIGKWAVIGAGSVVTKSIPDYAVAVGAPASVIKINKPNG
jgi:sugar O-acyltransferase (sialic acid O-acetyltransferase NeuD family)